MAIKGTIFAVLISIYVGSGAYNYAKPMKVVNWNGENVLKDSKGTLRRTKDELKVGENVMVILSNEGTADETDDVIIKILK